MTALNRYTDERLLKIKLILIIFFSFNGIFHLKAQPTRYLFLDTAFVSNKYNVSFKINPPDRKEIVINHDKPWEDVMISFYLSVFEDEGKLRMWYICRDSLLRGHVAYAESADGINWVKPNLGIVDYNGSKENNLVNLEVLDGMVYKDPHANNSGEKYIYIGNNSDGSYRYCSSDGITWARDSLPLLPFFIDSQHIVFWDNLLDKYVLYLRGWYPNDPDSQLRTVVRYTAKNLSKPLHFDRKPIFKEKDTRVMIVDEMPVVITTDKLDPPKTDVYTSSVQPYPLDPRWYIGFPSYFRHFKHRSDGRLEVHFVGSKDGINWQRYDRNPYAELGLQGSECENMLFMGPGMILKGDEIWQYGTGFHSRHGDMEARKKKTDGVIYRYVQRIDGFVSLDFGNGLANCITDTVKIEGTNLILNVDNGALGSIRVGIIGVDGEPISGFTESDCDFFQVNSTHYKVSWHGKSDLSLLYGKEVCLVLSGQRTKLYSFYFQD